MIKTHLIVLDTKSLLLRLFVFIATLHSYIYCHIFCFTFRFTNETHWHSRDNFKILKKHFIFHLISSQASSIIAHTLNNYLQLLIILINNLKKRIKYTHKALKYSLTKLKSSQNPSKAVELYSTWLLFSIFQVRYGSFFNPNPTL